VVHAIAFSDKNELKGISADPIRTLAGSGTGDARAMFAFQQKHSPLGRGVTLDELGGSALYLLSELSGGKSTSWTPATMSSRCRGRTN